MESLLFLLSLIAVGIIVHWSITNDKVPLYGKTRGLLSMTDGEYETLAQQPRPSRKIPSSAWRGRESQPGSTHFK